MNWLKVDHDKFFKASKTVGRFGPIVVIALCLVIGILSVTEVIHWEETGWNPGIMLFAILGPIFGSLTLFILIERLLYRISCIAYQKQTLNEALEILYSEIVQKIAIGEQLDNGGPDDEHLESFKLY